ncbi:MAG: hypothetical protein KatS3mg108_0130 [Isosphaeraceae bacterium]|jgi:hypothetical protein|nr:MAG: hypothetical protein KatS3mg108_0130 [Isosphaeraceae bacterium]
MKHTTHRFCRLVMSVLIAGMLVAMASWQSLHARQDIYECQDPKFYCEAKGCFPENGRCQNVPLNYTSRTVEPFLVSLCAPGNVPDCDNMLVATCVSKGWVADATKACGQVVCYVATYALGCDESGSSGSPRLLIPDRSWSFCRV